MFPGFCGEAHLGRAAGRALEKVKVNRGSQIQIQYTHIQSSIGARKRLDQKQIYISTLIQMICDIIVMTAACPIKHETMPYSTEVRKAVSNDCEII